MNHLNPIKTGLALGKVWGGLHLIWAILVAFGWAQDVVTFGLWSHMVSVPYTVRTFDLGASIVAIIVAAVLGYIVGFVFARIFNWLHQ